MEQQPPNSDALLSASRRGWTRKAIHLNLKLRVPLGSGVCELFSLSTIQTLTLDGKEDRPRCPHR